MSEEAELTLKSGLKYQVEIHDVMISVHDRNLLKGKFKNTANFQKQITADAKVAGSWKAVQEMNIEFKYNEKEYDCAVLVQDVHADYIVFEVVKEKSL